MDGGCTKVTDVLNQARHNAEKHVAAIRIKYADVIERPLPNRAAYEDFGEVCVFLGNLQHPAAEALLAEWYLKLASRPADTDRGIAARDATLRNLSFRNDAVIEFILDHLQTLDGSGQEGGVLYLGRCCRTDSGVQARLEQISAASMAEDPGFQYLLREFRRGIP